MTLPTDQRIDPDRLSPHARSMLALQDAVLLEWGRRVRAAVQEAAHLPHPILINTFPGFYQNLVEAISPDHPRQTAGANATVASEHGGERARLTGYKPHAIVAEYQALRWALFDVLKQNGVQLDRQEKSVINTSIDEAIGQSVAAFSLAQAVLRERFVTALTHDLRNPLAAAKMAAEMISRSADGDRLREFAARVTQNLNRMDEMIQELLDSVLFQSGERLRLQLENFDMRQVAQEVCDEFADMHGPRFHLSGASVAGRWDRRAIKRALENLVGNAVKYGETGKPVRIKLESYHGRIIVLVHNEGPPIPMEQMELVFKLFGRAAAAKAGEQQGWGIGLPYVRAVAESHGGSVQVDSAAGRGVTFSIDLPLDATPFLDAPTLAEKLP